MTEFLARGIYPFLFQGVFRWAIILVEHAEHSRERELRELVRCEFICDVMPEFVLGSVVVLLFLDDFEAAAFARISRIEGAGEKFDALIDLLRPGSDASRSVHVALLPQLTLRAMFMWPRVPWRLHSSLRRFRREPPFPRFSRWISSMRIQVSSETLRRCHTDELRHPP